MDIKLQNIAYAHEGEVRNQIDGIDKTIPQGSIICIHGAVSCHHENKSELIRPSQLSFPVSNVQAQQTFMKLLSQSIFPSAKRKGEDPLIFVPPHLRVIQISQVQAPVRSG